MNWVYSWENTAKGDRDPLHWWSLALWCVEPVDGWQMPSGIFCSHVLRGASVQEFGAPIKFSGSQRDNIWRCASETKEPLTTHFMNILSDS